MPGELWAKVRQPIETIPQSRLMAESPSGREALGSLVQETEELFAIFERGERDAIQQALAEDDSERLAAVLRIPGQEMTSRLQRIGVAVAVLVDRERSANPQSPL